jgi:ankyrin repeat protein
METEFDIFKDYDYEKEYMCSNDIKACNFSKLMYLLTISSKISSEMILEYLTKHKEEANKTNSIGWNALHFTVRNSQKMGLSYLIEPLIECIMNIDQQTNDGSTALMIAAKYANSDSNILTLKTLIAHGANVNKQDINGQTALMLAAANIIKCDGIGNHEAVKILLDNGAIIDMKNIWGHTALMVACQSENMDMNTVFLLLDYGSDYFEVDKNGYTVFYHIVKSNPTKLLTFFDRILEMNHYRLCMKNVIKAIPNNADKIMFRPNSMRVKLLGEKWKEISSNIRNFEHYF